MWKFLPVALLVLSGRQPAYAQDSALKALEALQTQTSDGFFIAGTFPSFRVHGKVRSDNNIFFTGLIALGLEDMRGRLDATGQVICDSIVARARRAYPYFRNREGRPTYNFWRTDPPVIFPGDPVLEHLDKVDALPDDLDDTSILMATLAASKDTAAELHRLMAEYANTKLRRVRNYYRRYKDVPAYSTWFGKRMPVDLDCCVLANALYWVCRAGLPFDREDSASAFILRDMIGRGLPWKDPAYASPHYGRVPVIVYDLSRLVGTYSVPGLEDLRPALGREAKLALDTARDPMDRVILASSLLRLGETGGDPVAGKVGSEPVALDARDGDFVFFVASFSDYFRNPFRRIFLHSGLIRYEFVCPAYNMMLALEYAVLSKGVPSRSAGSF